MSKDEVIAKINALTPLIITCFGLINSILTLRGLPAIEIGNEVITEVVNGLATIIGTCWGWWRNNNWTVEAQVTQPVLNELKAGTITTQQVESLVKSAETNQN